MNWKHVQLIYKREMIDQLRDRRTIFTITILPLLLYPLLGMLMMQVAQFHRESPVKVAVLGYQNWPEELPLLDESGNIALKSVSDETRRLLKFELQSVPSTQSDIMAHARELMAANSVDAVLVIKPELAEIATGKVDKDRYTENWYAKSGCGEKRCKR